jgi:hypothetical protein
VLRFLCSRCPLVLFRVQLPTRPLRPSRLPVQRACQGHGVLVSAAPKCDVPCQWPLSAVPPQTREVRSLTSARGPLSGGFPWVAALPALCMDCRNRFSASGQNIRRRRSGSPALRVCRSRVGGDLTGDSAGFSKTFEKSASIIRIRFQALISRKDSLRKMSFQSDSKMQGPLKMCARWRFFAFLFSGRV